MQREDFDAVKILSDGLGERAFLDDVITAVPVSKDCGIPRELATLIRAFQFKLERFVLTCRGFRLRRYTGSSFSLNCHTGFLLSSEIRAS